MLFDCFTTVAECYPAVLLLQYAVELYNCMRDLIQSSLNFMKKMCVTFPWKTRNLIYPSISLNVLLTFSFRVFLASVMKEKAL